MSAYGLLRALAWRVVAATALAVLLSGCGADLTGDHRDRSDLDNRVQPTRGEP